MLTIDYPHEKPTGLMADARRVLFLCAMSIFVAEAAVRNSVAITLRLLKGNSNSESIKSRIRQIFKDLQKDSRHITSIAFNKFSEINKFIKVNAATSHALERHYDYDEYVKEYAFAGILDRWTSDFWMRETYGSRAIRNRYHCVLQLLFDSMEDVMQKRKELRLLSLASGSAKAVLEAAKMIREKYPTNPISILLVDIDKRALMKAQKEVEEEAPFVQFSMKVGSVFRLDKIHQYIAEFSPSIVEMVGFLDYIGDDAAPQILRQLGAHEPDHFLTCNIIPNMERIALHTIIMWPPMFYRNPLELKKIMDEGGFEQAELYVEPYGTHAVTRWKKDTSVN